jgi:hypothetical protein
MADEASVAGLDEAIGRLADSVGSIVARRPRPFVVLRLDGLPPFVTQP